MDYLKNHCFRYKAILVFSVESKIKTEFQYPDRSIECIQNSLANFVIKKFGRITNK